MLKEWGNKFEDNIRWDKDICLWEDKWLVDMTLSIKFPKLFFLTNAKYVKLN